YVKVNGRWAYLYRAVDSRGRTVDFYLSSRRNSKAAYRFLGKILNNVKKWQIDLSLNNVTDSEAFPGLIRQTHRKIRAASADGAYDTRLCHDELRRKKISALIP
ncbi:DDE-type integrase/transposase/recombinase, partial [Klebsiella pneumoniae]|uniref:DDE-type integrase/transposase/recombinase n=1 Tax=Klebsiella pneumoniae TaxID=573 RepID=UPI0039836022